MKTLLGHIVFIPVTVIVLSVGIAVLVVVAVVASVLSLVPKKI